MPSFNGLEALALVQQHGLDVPFILLSGTIGEETAVAALKAGAHDYIMKDNMARLVPAVKRELREADERHLRRQAEKALQESERFAYATIDALQAHIAILDEQGYIVAVNAAWRAFGQANGWSDPQFGVGTSYLDICHMAARAGDDTAQQVDQGIRAVLEMRVPSFALEYPCHAPWEQRWFILNVTRFAGESQVRAVVAHQNTTARVQAAEALRASEQRLRAVVRSAPILLFALDGAGRFTLRDGRALTALGSGPHLRVGQSLFDAYPTLPAVHAAARRALAGEEAVVRAAASGRLFETHYVPEVDDEGIVTGVIGVSTDITERVEVEEALHASAERFRLLAENATDMIARLSPEGRFLYVSPASVRMLGHTPDDLFGHAVAEFVHPEDRAAAMTTPTIPGAEQDGDISTYRIQHKDGHYLWVETVHRTIRDPQNGAVREIHAASRDVTTRKQAEDALRQSEQHFRTLIDNAPIGACIVDRQDVFVSVNDAYCALLGYTHEELVGHSVAMLYPHGRRPEAAAQASAQAYAQGHAGGVFALVTKAGRLLTVLARTTAITGLDGQPQRAAFLVDITAQVQREESLTRLAHYDELTELGNRVLFHDALRREVARAYRHKHLLALIYLDLDGFKAVNDTRGHDVGDQLLRAVARRLRACIRESDTAARLGGDEFTVLLHDVQAPADAAAVAEKILSIFATGVCVGDVILPVNASIGISLYSGEGQEGQDLLARADAAMYEAKKQGKNRYAFAAGPGQHIPPADPSATSY